MLLLHFSRETPISKLSIISTLAKKAFEVQEEKTPNSSDKPKASEKPAEPQGRQLSTREQMRAKLSKVGSEIDNTAALLGRAEHIWFLLLLSLPVDLILAHTSPNKPTLGLSILNQSALFFALLALTGFFRRELIDHLGAIKDLIQSWSKHRLAKSGLIAIAAFFAIIEALIKVRELKISPIFSILLVLGVLALALPSFVKQIKEQQKALEQRIRDPFEWVSFVNRQLLAINIMPSIFARLISITAILQLRAGISEADLILCLGTSLFFLILLKPTREDFYARCSACARPTPRALKSMGVCPGCAPKTFAVNQPLEQPSVEQKSDRPPQVKPSDKSNAKDSRHTHKETSTLDRLRERIQDRVQGQADTIKQLTLLRKKKQPQQGKIRK